MLPRGAVILVSGLACFTGLIPRPSQADEIVASSIAKDAYAILNRSCFECHGPSRQEGGLRLDSTQAFAMGGDSGRPLDILNPDASELLRRIRLPKGHEDVMPNRGAILTDREVARIREWIALGAPWTVDAAAIRHWAYVAPVKSMQLLTTTQPTPQPIDFFIQKRLESDRLTVSPAADLVTLVRRLYFDITGLPPTPAQADAFAEQATSNLQGAVERLVDRLLPSPQYGEKWARPWLDAARYADSHGFQRDDLHELWAYRDWVIQALNDDMPFDQFSIEQLAGDLLPNPTQSQIIATGFNRCAPCNVEAGTDPLENRFNQVVDRVNTLGYVWLGSTLECAQCHDHKYDPFKQRDYYGLFAFFNQTELEADRSNPNVPGSIRFVGPYLNLSGTDEEQELKVLNEKIILARAGLDSALQESVLADNKSESVSLTCVLKPIEFDSSGGAGHKFLDDGSILLQDDPPDLDTYSVTVKLGPEPVVGFLLETLTDPSLPGTGPGRGDAARPNFVLNSFEARLATTADDTTSKSIQLTDARADFSQKNYEVANAIDSDLKSGWAIGTQFKRPHWAAFRIAATNDLKGEEQVHFRLVQNFGSARTIGRFRLSALVGDYEKSLPIERKESLAVANLRKSLAALENERDKIAVPKSLVMRVVREPRTSTMYARGDFRNPTEQIEPATPEVLHAYQEKGDRNRLALARWLVSRNNPLVGRVAVNRLWSEIFGVGLVSTPEDFGLKGDTPSHPELLDWLAVDFTENGWSQKKLLRKILISTTYRQASRLSVEARELDPQNRLLARGPRFRLTAEGIRDNALAISGKLSLKQFGPPIRPPQPDGLWKKVGGQQYDYEVSPGEDRYRRGVYVVLKRMSPYPSFINFDATARLACRVNRGRSNTPLQALNLLNDPVYVDAAKGLVLRVLREKPDSSLEQQLEHAFRIVVARLPSQRERDTLQQLFASELVAKLNEVSFGKQTEKTDSEQAKSAAWFAVASTLLNLDETITKE